MYMYIYMYIYMYNILANNELSSFQFGKFDEPLYMTYYDRFVVSTTLFSTFDGLYNR